jgi:hypothetical protein
MIYAWKFNGNHQHYLLQVHDCTDYEAVQIYRHTAVDTKAIRFFNPFTGKLEVPLLSEYAYDMNSVWHTIDWIKEDVLSRKEVIKYDWSQYLDSLLGNRHDDERM